MSNKRRESSSNSHPSNSQKKRNEKEGGCQGREASSNECAACFGLYEYDVDPETGDVVCEWIQCTGDDCNVWMHTDCVEKKHNDFVCGAIFS